MKISSSYILMVSLITSVYSTFISSKWRMIWNSSFILRRDLYFCCTSRHHRALELMFCFFFLKWQFSAMSPLKFDWFTEDEEEDDDSILYVLADILCFNQRLCCILNETLINTRCRQRTAKSMHFKFLSHWRIYRWKITD